MSEMFDRRRHEVEVAQRQQPNVQVGKSERVR